jgi:hypothetical protein
VFRLKQNKAFCFKRFFSVETYQKLNKTKRCRTRQPFFLGFSKVLYLLKIQIPYRVNNFHAKQKTRPSYVHSISVCCRLAYIDPAYILFYHPSLLSWGTQRDARRNAQWALRTREPEHCHLLAPFISLMLAVRP